MLNGEIYKMTDHLNSYLVLFCPRETILYFE